MRLRLFFLALYLGLFAAGPAMAAPTAQRDSTAFVSTVDQIEGDAVPTTLTDWSNVGSPFITDNLDGTLTMVTPSDAFPAIKHNEGDNDFSSSKGWTWETRFRIDAANDPARGVWEIFLRDNDSGSLAATRIHFLSTGIDRDAAGFGVDAEVPIDLTDDFHVVRAAVTPDNLTSVWVDDELVIDQLVSNAFDATEFSRIGRWGGQSRGGTTTIDYIRFDTTGAYAPVAEPCSVALAALAAMGLGLRKRRLLG